MGFATFVLKGLHPAAAFTWKLAKLAHKLKTSSGPLPTLEKVAVFGADFFKPEIALAYFVARSIVDKVLAKRWAKSTDKYLEIMNPEHELTLEQVNTAFDVTKHNRAPKELLAKAGFLYLSEALRKFQAGDKVLKARYTSKQGGGFDHVAALQDFYGTEASGKLSRALGNYDNTTLTDAVRKDKLLPIVDEAWAEVQNKLREDAVDFLVL